jgi:hypothetical protein
MEQEQQMSAALPLPSSYQTYVHHSSTAKNHQTPQDNYP